MRRKRVMRRLENRLLAMFLGISMFVSQAGFAARAEETAESVTKAHIVKLTVSGIADGTEPFDEDDNRGNDSGSNNLRVRSYDSVTYSIEAEYESTNLGETYASGRVGYEFIIPDDPELSLDLGAMEWAQDYRETTAEGNRVYTLYRNLPQTNGQAIPGGCTVEFVLKVGGKHEGDTIQPRIRAWVEGNEEIKEVSPDGVRVTSVPKYNITLIKEDVSAKNNYNFEGNPYNPDAGTVAGYEVRYGFALQLRNDNLDRGIKGIEVPDGTPITFDVELSSLYTPDNGSASDVTGSFTPLLWAVKGNGEDNRFVWGIPVTGPEYGYEGHRCYNSGSCDVTQENNTLHFTVRDYKIDKDSFPQASANGSYSYQTADGKIQIGCFSAFRFIVVQPVVLNDGTKLGNDGNIQINANDTNMRVTSLHGDVVSAQTYSEDDETACVRRLGGAGDYRQEIFFSTPGNMTSGTDPESHTKNDGTDSAVMGSTLAYSAAYSESEAGGADMEAHTIAFDQLVKFDDAMLEVDSNMEKEGGDDDWHYTVRFAGKEGGWDHKGLKPSEEGYDAEMKAAKEESAELHYYDTYEELTAAGDRCVGILYQWRGCNTKETESSFHEMVQTNVRVRENEDISGNVAMLTLSTNAWLADELDAEKAARRLGIAADSLTLADYKNYAQNYFDSYFLEDQKADAKNPSLNIDKDDSYKKAVYDESGYKGGETGGFSDGDSLYIVPYKTIVSKHVAQRNGADAKQSFDMDAGQRYVDFIIAGNLEFEQGVNVGNDDWTTEVILKDTLPKGLTYIEESAYLDGIYAEQTPNAGIVSDGTPVIPEITQNDDGTTTLVWRIPDVQVKNGAIPNIHYSCEIGDRLNPAEDVKNHDSLETRVEMTTTEDKRIKTVYNGNVSTAAISVVKLKSFNIAKTGTKYIETDGKGSFELVVNNSSENARSDLCAIDMMPQDGIQGTVMKGSYKITALTLNLDALGKNDGIKDVAFYYTDAPEYLGKNGAEISKDEIVKNWKKAEINENTGSITGQGLIGAWPAAMAYLDEELDAMRTAQITLEYQADKGQKEDVLINSFILGDLKTTAQTSVVSRSLSGTAWKDHNNNGGYDEGETLLKNIPVVLYRKNHENQWEKAAETQTDEGGRYSFENLKGGVYQVQFVTSEEIPFDSYDVTEKEAQGISENRNSKAEGIYEEENGKLKQAVIREIEIPTLDEMLTMENGSGGVGITAYVLADQNLGLIEKDPGPDNPGTDDPGPDNPGTDNPGTDNPGTDDPGTDNPGTDNPGTDNPGTDDPGPDNPGTDNPGTDNPGADNPGTDDPGPDNPGTDNPGQGNPRPNDSDQNQSLAQTKADKGNGNTAENQSKTTTVKTGDADPVCAAAVMSVISFAALLIILVFSYRRKYK